VAQKGGGHASELQGWRQCTPIRAHRQLRVVLNPTSVLTLMPAPPHRQGYSDHPGVTTVMGLLEDVADSVGGDDCGDVLAWLMAREDGFRWGGCLGGGVSMADGGDWYLQRVGFLGWTNQHPPNLAAAHQ
jgi:hypothetical protein